MRRRCFFASSGYLRGVNRRDRRGRGSSSEHLLVREQYQRPVQPWPAEVAQPSDTAVVQQPGRHVPAVPAGACRRLGRHHAVCRRRGDQRHSQHAGAEAPGRARLGGGGRWANGHLLQDPRASALIGRPCLQTTPRPALKQSAASPCAVPVPHADRRDPRHERHGNGEDATWRADARGAARTARLAAGVPHPHHHGARDHVARRRSPASCHAVRRRAHRHRLHPERHGHAHRGRRLDRRSQRAARPVARCRRGAARPVRRRRQHWQRIRSRRRIRPGSAVDGGARRGRRVRRRLPELRRPRRVTGHSAASSVCLDGTAAACLRRRAERSVGVQAVRVQPRLGRRQRRRRHGHH
mmetsp:Transcript_22401/g.78495  ORF Transcript_22401/g.78495 Transcript_22401/m.78495 type:complete len:353 (-) Transcript_22401:2698-3756(-)